MYFYAIHDQPKFMLQLDGLFDDVLKSCLVASENMDVGIWKQNSEKNVWT